MVSRHQAAMTSSNQVRPMKNSGLPKKFGSMVSMVLCWMNLAPPMAVMNKPMDAVSGQGLLSGT